MAPPHAEARELCWATGPYCTHRFQQNCSGAKSRDRLKSRQVNSLQTLATLGTICRSSAHRKMPVETTSVQGQTITYSFECVRLASATQQVISQLRTIEATKPQDVPKTCRRLRTAARRSQRVTKQLKAPAIPRHPKSTTATTTQRRIEFVSSTQSLRPIVCARVVCDLLNPPTRFQLPRGGFPALADWL